MKIAVVGNPISFDRIKSIAPEVNWIPIELTEVKAQEFSALFNLNENAYQEDYSNIGYPVFINSVSNTLNDNIYSPFVVRINGWKGFIERDIWEIAGAVSLEHEKILKVLNKQFIRVADEPGFVAARILAMIINEAYFAKEENVSSSDSIDIAMKLGTNYPFGPFEWKDNIGIKNILTLLKKLQEKDNRYTPSAQLIEEANQS